MAANRSALSWAPGFGVVVRRELVDDVVGQAGEALVDTRGEPNRGEGIDNGAVRRGRAFVARAVEDDAVVLLLLMLFVRTGRGLARQPTLADSRRAEHDGEARDRIVGEERAEPAQLGVASEDPRSARVDDRCRQRQ